VFTNPKDTLTQLEFIPSPTAPGGPVLLRDPRYEPGWSPSWWADYHPLQIQKASHVTVSTFDLDDSVRHLERKGVRVQRADDDTVVTDVDTTYGCVMAFTTAGIPDDPRADWTAHVEGPVPATLFSAPP
jgi:hypothetical protein